MSNGKKPRLRKSKPSIREILTGVLSKVTENPLMDWMYYSPQESFEDVFGNQSSFYIRKPEERVGSEVSKEGLLDLWKQSGSPFLYSEPADISKYRASFRPRGASWHTKKSVRGLSDLIFGADKVFVGDYFGTGGGSAQDLIPELAHSIMFADPKTWSGGVGRKKLIKGKTEESEFADKVAFDLMDRLGVDFPEAREISERGLYRAEGSQEYKAHKEIEPILLEWLTSHYGIK